MSRVSPVRGSGYTHLLLRSLFTRIANCYYVFGMTVSSSDGRVSAAGFYRDKAFFLVKFCRLDSRSETCVPIHADRLDSLHDTIRHQKGNEKE